MIQHRQFNSFFFKSIEDFQKYKNNDKMKNTVGLLGNAVMIRLEDESITYLEFKKIISEYDYIFKEGLSDEYIREQKNKIEKSKKENEYKEKLKERKEKQNRDFRRMQEEKNKAYRDQKLREQREQRKRNKTNEDKGKKSITKNNQDKFKKLFSD